VAENVADDRLYKKNRDCVPILSCQVIQEKSGLRPDFVLSHLEIWNFCFIKFNPQ
jgi:hypothetical protein